MVGERVVDALVIGGGPAGSTTAYEVAMGGFKVLMIEKRSEIGIPVRCGEGISKEILSILNLKKDPSWICSEMDGARLISPCGKVMVIGPEIAGPETGFVIRREIFDRMLAERAAAAGADLWVNAEATSFDRVEGGAVVNCIHDGKEVAIKAKVVVAADGFESQVARWGGLNTVLAERDIDTCIQYEMMGVDVDEKYVEFYMGKRYAPGGYIWSFPKGENISNVGIGMNATAIKRGGDPKRYLDDFIRNNDRFSKGIITEINAGAVSVGLPIEKTVADRMLVVGDAARMIDPLTGGGVFTACISGQEAGRTIVKALEEGDTSAEGLSGYERAWRDQVENQLVRNYLAKEKLLDLDDEVLDKVIEGLSEYDLKEVSTQELLKGIVKKHPELMNDLTGLI
ncbi:MAG: NAD(P)/FAD-dependent oxidoreductase [Thermoplasmata archaeon]|nr:NAD(P)/FAD-dependent oxidoreductase [Thermoplasmata archaeon]